MTTVESGRYERGFAEVRGSRSLTSANSLQRSPVKHQTVLPVREANRYDSDPDADRDMAMGLKRVMDSLNHTYYYYTYGCPLLIMS
jgi:hypothetical protein